MSDSNRIPQRTDDGTMNVSYIPFHQDTIESSLKNKDCYAIDSQIEIIVEKLTNMYPAGFTILVPTSNSQTSYIANAIKSKSRNVMIVNDILLKVTTIEAFNAAVEPDSLFRQLYTGQMNKRLKELRMYLNRMDKSYDGYFTRHLVSNRRMRNALTYTIKHSEAADGKYIKLIDEQPILLIDNSNQSGQSSKEVISVLKSYYDPKSITVLTLFSKLYEGN